MEPNDVLPGLAFVDSFFYFRALSLFVPGLWRPRHLKIAEEEEVERGGGGRGRPSDRVVVFSK